MKKLTLLILIFAVALAAACTPARTPLPGADPAHSTVAATKAAKNPTALPPSPQFSNIPLSESLLLLRYNAKKQHHLLTSVDPSNGRELAGAAPISLEQ